ncbi:SDR family oxidoreductase [Kineosporia sp. NBRC 101731]|uniref:NAD-dependent epimerase/dehydratase family protein n=1 Tax=Kineosporia sp. NBRC 101731 TaxID=3032199 RepID=UPI0024A301B9|nr:SDR family oxidoreductase [Kineosporia sp. NBRC 101731]GLY32461.1 hypothetical protein Kisp02_58260 [Kineosporia sp. NBRC 101731]
MDVIGTGFLARHLATLENRHRDVIALAAGVSWASGTSAADFAREEALVRRTAERCRNTGRTLLFFSTASAGVYGSEKPGLESDPPHARSPYGAHKLGLEEVVRCSGADHLVLRLGHLVGPGQPEHQLLPTLTRRLRSGSVTVQRHATRDLVDVTDVVGVIDALLSAGARQQIVNVASGYAVPVGLVIDHLELRLGTQARREFQDAGASHRVGIGKLRTLVAADRLPAFGPDYFRRVLDDFVAAETTRTPT